MKARYEYFKHHEHDPADLILSNNENMGKLMTSIPFVSATCANLGMKVAGKIGVLGKMGLGNEAPLPSYATMNFATRFKRLQAAKLYDESSLLPRMLR